MLKSFRISGLLVVCLLSGGVESALGMEFKVLGLHGEVLHQETVRVDLTRSVGALTVERLHAARMEFEGSESGIVSIAGLGNQSSSRTGTGSSAIRRMAPQDFEDEARGRLIRAIEAWMSAS